MGNLARWQKPSAALARDYLVHERIVILTQPCQLLSNNHWSRLNA